MSRRGRRTHSSRRHSTALPPASTPSSRSCCIERRRWWRRCSQDADDGASRSLDVLDAGCGTGLCGPLIAPYARRLVGVDLSERMLDQARARNVYDELVRRELTAYLRELHRRVRRDRLGRHSRLFRAARGGRRGCRERAACWRTAHLHRRRATRRRARRGVRHQPERALPPCARVRRARAGGCEPAVGDRPGRAAARGRRAGSGAGGARSERGSGPRLRVSDLQLVLGVAQAA